MLGDGLFGKKYQEKMGTLPEQVAAKKAEDEINKEAKKEMDDANKEVLAGIHNRVPEYKLRWNKNGVIQFKNERIAILKRALGEQVEFIIAYDDLTKEGYRLMAQDEGMQAGGGSLAGGVNSTYYFQKIELVTAKN